MNTAKPRTNRRIVRYPEVERMTGKSRSTLYRDIAAGKFPKPIRIGLRAVGWFDDEIDDHLDALARGEVL